MSSQQELSELFSSPFIESFNWDETFAGIEKNHLPTGIFIDWLHLLRLDSESCFGC